MFENADLHKIQKPSPVFHPGYYCVLLFLSALPDDMI
jgi:hypothetical protein